MARNVKEVCGQGIVIKYKVRSWFQKIRHGECDVEDGEVKGSDDEDEFKASPKVNRSATSREPAEELTQIR